ncbi:hypothetical protein E2C01_102094 [Portunus trituberculatus]|uniref:Uncharacterized protein n=1 Tax=Portunus trituberculatus TaxID=210409 RepID=A0A5B7KLS2_PORTR|nr:hypothetical protein [Portunus trituberculatus]
MLTIVRLNDDRLSSPPVLGRRAVPGRLVGETVVVKVKVVVVVMVVGTWVVGHAHVCPGRAEGGAGDERWRRQAGARLWLLRHS